MFQDFKHVHCTDTENCPMQTHQWLDILALLLQKTEIITFPLDTKYC